MDEQVKILPNSFGWINCSVGMRIFGSVENPSEVIDSDPAVVSVGNAFTIEVSN
jgi:hypothetical protein